MIWVKIWNLPIHWFTKEAGKKIGQVFSAVKEVVIPNTGSRDGRHMKILAEIDLTQPIVRGTMVDMNGMTKWIAFKYERCPDFYFNCGIIGHNEKNCKWKSLINHHNMVIGSEPVSLEAPKKSHTIPELLAVYRKRKGLHGTRPKLTKRMESFT